MKRHGPCLVFSSALRRFGDPLCLIAVICRIQPCAMSRYCPLRDNVPLLASHAATPLSPRRGVSAIRCLIAVICRASLPHLALRSAPPLILPAAPFCCASADSRGVLEKLARFPLLLANSHRLARLPLGVFGKVGSQNVFFRGFSLQKAAFSPIRKALLGKGFSLSNGHPRYSMPFGQNGPIFAQKLKSVPGNRRMQAGTNAKAQVRRACW